MSVRFYMDVHVPGPITRGLRTRGVDVLTSQDDATNEQLDSVLLDRATGLGRVLVTRDEDFLTEAALRLRRREFFAGIVYGHQESVTIGRAIADLELIAKCCDPSDLENRVMRIPLK